MISQTLSLWDNGAVTLPKKWRDRYPTKHFIAEEQQNGTLNIRPILDFEYWEKKDGSFGLHIPNGGMPMEQFAALFKEAHERLIAEENEAKKKHRRSAR